MSGAGLGPRALGLAGAALGIGRAALGAFGAHPRRRRRGVPAPWLPGAGGCGAGSPGVVSGGGGGGRRRVLLPRRGRSRRRELARRGPDHAGPAVGQKPGSGRAVGADDDVRRGLAVEGAGGRRPPRRTQRCRPAQRRAALPRRSVHTDLARIAQACRSPAFDGDARAWKSEGSAAIGHLPALPDACVFGRCPAQAELRAPSVVSAAEVLERLSAWNLPLHSCRPPADTGCMPDQTAPSVETVLPAAPPGARSRCSARSSPSSASPPRRRSSRRWPMPGPPAGRSASGWSTRAPSAATSWPRRWPTASASTTSISRTSPSTWRRPTSSSLTWPSAWRPCLSDSSGRARWSWPCATRRTSWRSTTSPCSPATTSAPPSPRATTSTG